MPSCFWTRCSVDSGKRWTRTSICRNSRRCRHLLHRDLLLSKRGSRNTTSFLLSRIHKGIWGVRSRPLARLSELALASDVTTRRRNSEISSLSRKNKVIPLSKSTPNTFDLRPVGFSILNELELDLELEDEDPFPTAPPLWPHLWQSTPSHRR